MKTLSEMIKLYSSCKISVREFLEWRKRWRANKNTRAKALSDHNRRANEREKRMKPVKSSWRIGRQIFWEEPDVDDDLQVNYYTIHEGNEWGNWCVHATRTPANKHEASLYGDGPCKVEVSYTAGVTAKNRNKLFSPLLEWHREDPKYLVSHMRYYAQEAPDSHIHSQRWRQALAALGVVDAKVGKAGGRLIYPLNPPMTLAEAQGYADKGWGRWYPVVRVMKRLESEQRRQNK